MQVGALIKRLSFKELLRMSFIFVQHPHYMYPTFIATRDTIDICNHFYKKEHHLMGKENAFRHALWNALLCKQIFKLKNDTSKAMQWAKKITDLHEELAPNPVLDKAMDLHNNEFGRQFFVVHSQQDKSKLINELQQQLKRSIKVSGLEDFKAAKGFMVYINSKN